METKNGVGEKRRPMDNCGLRIKEDVGKPNGHFKLVVCHKDGRREVVEDHNLVLDMGRNLLARLLAGETNDYITYAAIGNGSDPETVDDTELTNQMNILLDSEEVDKNVAIFKFTIPFDTANGMDIHEFGLVSGDGVLFCRRMRQSSLVKEDDIQIEGTWEVTL